MRPQLLAPADPEPRQFLCDLSMLISEARVPDARLKGRSEGPHCPSLCQSTTKGQQSQEATERHSCEGSNPLCQKAKKFLAEVVNLWSKGIPVMIQLSLLPGTCDSTECLSDATVLERWHLETSTKRNADDKVLPCHFLIQGIRSYLHFSQLSSWLAAHEGKLPFSLHYRVCVPGETEWHSVTQQQCSSETAKNNTVELRKHEFPLCSLGKTGTVRVFVEAQRYAETPTITCACQSAAQTSSKSDQKSAVPLPRLSESSIGSTETDEESILDGFLPDSSNTLKVVDRRRQRQTPVRQVSLSVEDSSTEETIREDHGSDEIFESSSFSSSLSEDTHFSSTSVTPVKTDNFCWSHQRSQSPSKTVTEAARKSQILRPTPNHLPLPNASKNLVGTSVATVAPTFAENPMFQTSSVDSMEELLRQKIRALRIEANNISTRWRGFNKSKTQFDSSAIQTSSTNDIGNIDIRASHIDNLNPSVSSKSPRGDVKFFIAAEDGDETWNGTGSAHLSDSFYMGDSSMTSEPESSTPARRPRERTRSTKILISSGETFETAAHDLLDLYQFDDEHLDRTEDMHDMVDNSFVDLDSCESGSKLPLNRYKNSSGINHSGPHCSLANPAGLSATQSSNDLPFGISRTGVASSKQSHLSLPLSRYSGAESVSRQLFATVNTNQDGMESIPKAEEKMEQLTSFSSAESTPQSQSGIFGEEIKNPQLKPKHPIHKVISSTAGSAQSLRSLREATLGRFNDRTGLPLSSSPAPLKRNQHSFDFDASLTGARAIRNVLYDHESGSSDSECGTPMCKSAPASSHLLGNFEESALNGRLKPYGSLEGFTVELGASGAFCPPHLTLPLTTLFFNLSDDNSPSPYFGHCSLASIGRKGYHVPKKGNLQVTLFNPQQTVVKMFVVRFDFSDMPPGCQTFVRQRTFYMPVISGLQDALKNRSWLRYLIHLRFATSRSGKLYVHTDLRMLFSRKSELEAKNLNGGVVEENFELRSFTEMPKNPKFSPRKLTRAT